MPHHQNQTIEKRFLISLALTGLILLAEVIGGLWTGSLALLSDAAHVFLDIFALGLSYAALLTGLLSAGGKVLQVPLYNAALGRHPKQAYALAALGVAVAAPVALAAQIGVGVSLTTAQVLLALYLFALIVGVALIVQRFWTPKLNQWVT